MLFRSFLIPFLRRTYSNRLGRQLLNKPLYLSNQHIIGSYEELNPPEKPNRRTKFVRFKNEKITKFKSKRDQFLCKNFNTNCELENELNENSFSKEINLDFKSKSVEESKIDKNVELFEFE